jgi:4-alpha-glucanotransferase
MNRPSTTLARLAQAADVAVRYQVAGRTVVPPEDTLRSVLGALGHPCDDESAARRSLWALRRRPWVRPIDPVVAHWQDSPSPTRVTLSASARGSRETTLTLENGSQRPLPQPVWGGARVLDDDTRRRGTIELPADLPLGYHRLTMTDRRRTHACTVIVAPPTCPSPGNRRRWGWMVQTYAVLSSDSWGQGEFRDLSALASWSAAQGADFVLTNPLHAVAPTLPQQPSPYSPTSRRFVNPCYLHLPDLPEFGALPEDHRQALRRLPAELAPDTDGIDRDRVWDTKRTVLQRLFETMGAARHDQLARYRRERGVSLERFARFCALAEIHGLPFDGWPAGLRDPRSAEVDRWADDHADRVALHAWLQLLCEEQLAAVQERARQAGMSIGIIHDLAVGVDAAGADAWSLPDEMARHMTVGAPPDAFNQQGQNWAQPPPLPEAQRANGFRTFREVLRASLRIGGGLRIDHILGLSRLFWIPQGAGPADGTYVRYPADEQFAVLTLEAHRAGAIVVGEDLGTVDDRIRRLMHRRSVASSAVLYFEREGERQRAGGRGPQGEGERQRAGGRGPQGEPRPARSYPRRALASVTTHDLPTATGFWDGSAFELRAQLGLLTGSVADERRQFEEERRALLRLLLAHGCLQDRDADVRSRVLAMHRFLASTPSLLVAGALWDAVGDPRQPNVPGTTDSYPNWRLPLARPTPSGLEPVTLEAVMQSAAVHEMVHALGR